MIRKASDIVSGSFSSQLASPEWKAYSQTVKKQRGNFCQCCKRGDIELQVHHTYYEFGRDITDYHGDELVVLCVICHKAMHEELNKFRKYVFNKLDPQSFKIINGCLAVALEKYHPLAFAHALAEFVSHPSSVQSFCKSWNVSESQTLTPMPEKRVSP